MESIKTALLFDPYLDTLGGGERYTLTIAEILLDEGWQVDLAWHDQGIINQARDRFGLKLTNLNISGEYYNLFTQNPSMSLRYQALKNIDLVFIVSDGSVPVLFGKKTFLHYQVPFTSSNRPKLLNRLKLFTISKVIVNSQFTKKVVDNLLLSKNSVVLYPPIDTDLFTTKKKTKTILNVGRFASPSHSKRQDILINAFKKLVDSGLKDWQLILAGGQMGVETQLNDLQSQASGYPIKFIINPDFKKLQSLYSEASIYWHSAGFEVDEALNPESVEHFGITTVEAMSAGCVPIVISKGGQKEIVDEYSGYLWETIEDLITHTTRVIENPKLANQLSLAATKRALNFNVDQFRQNLLSLL